MSLQPLFTALGGLALSAAASAQLGTNYCTPAVANSTGQPGAMSASGSQVAGGNPLTLTATQLPANQFGYFLTSQTQGFNANPGGSQGNICLGGQIGRFNSQVMNSGSAGAISISVDTLAMPLSPNVAVQPGQTWNFQLWYRDVNPVATSNFSDGLEIAFTAGGGVNADFVGDVLQGTNPLVVNFTDLSTGSPTSWLWDFGDGSTSTMQNPSHTYLIRGDYSVTLTVMGGGSQDTLQRPNYIDVDQGFSDVWGYFTQQNLDPTTMQPTSDRCTDCHAAGFGFGGLQFPNQAGAYNNLVNVQSNCINMGGQPGGLRVDPGNPNGSLLYTKLVGTQACGSEMPQGSIFAGDVQVVANWILDGAQQ